MIVFSTLYLLEVHSPRSFAKNHVVQVDLLIKVKKALVEYIPKHSDLLSIIHWNLFSGMLKQEEDLDQNAGWI